MKKILILCFVVLTTTAFTQTSSFYYKKGIQKPITIDKSKVNIIVSNSFAKSSVDNLTPKNFDLKNTNTETEKWATIDFGSQLNDVEFLQKVNTLRNNPNIIAVGHHYKDKNNETVGTSNLFYIKLKKADDVALLQQQALAKNVVITGLVGQDPLWYGLKTTKQTTATALETANQFFATGLFDEIDPGFILRFVFDQMSASNTTSTQLNTTTGCSNDAEFNMQWGLNNPLNPATDINACAAWAIPGANGSGVKVGVVDTGIKLDHPDLTNNILQNDTYDSNLQSQPSHLSNDYQYYYYNNQGQLLYYKSNHGTHVAGIIGATGNNNIGVSGVAPACKIVAVSNQLEDNGLNISISLGYAIEWAATRDGGADIINCSWWFNNSFFDSSFLEDRILFALNEGRFGKGCIIVFSAGNNQQWQYVHYPAYIDPRIMVVGAMDREGIRAPFSSYGTSPDLELANNDVDLVAPGVAIRSLIVNMINLQPNTISTPTTTASSGNVIDQRFSDGTSMAAPHVSGTAALMLSVNPCLTGQEVRDIIEKTCQKVGGYNYVNTAGRPNGTWNNEMGYGLIDAKAATQMAKDLYIPFDLMIKDDIADLGIQPNPATNVWESPDIWVRNQQDNLQVHQTPVCYPTGQKNYVYVKVRNKGCNPTTGLETVQLYQSKTSTYINPDMPESRRANIPSYSNITNTLIGTVAMPVGLTAGQEAILKFSWQVPFPNFLPTPGGIEAQGIPAQSFNLLAKIITTTDPLAVPETLIAYNNIKNNNNIAGKSIIIKRFYNDIPYERISIGNPYNETKTFKLELLKEDAETGKAIYNEAEVNIKMDDVIYNAWQRGGKQEQNLKQTADDKKQIVENNHVLIDNVQLNANEEGFVTLNFNFLTDELTNKTNYKYHIIQRDKATNEIVGAVTYDIHKDPRPIFVADAGDDKEKDRNQTITISAQQISEPAIYNWYDTDGSLIFTGKDLTVAADVAKKYKLEVIATADGFKDYSEVEVRLKPSVLSVIAPNPATENVTIGYKINEGGSAYLMILGSYGTSYASNNYILNSNLNEININLTNYTAGFYTVALIVNGQIIDAKTLNKE